MFYSMMFGKTIQMIKAKSIIHFLELEVYFNSRINYDGYRIISLSHDKLLASDCVMFSKLE